ncbi:MAG: alpha/beta hydrolase [Thermoplasmatota archaeon]
MALLLAGCSAPAADDDAQAPMAVAMPDPNEAGPLTWKQAEYDFGQLLVDDSEVAVYRYTVPVHGSVHSPDGPGPYPLLVFLHGRHVTCSYAGFQFLGPGFCPNATVVEPVNSYQGYDYLASNLASHGYVVVSIDANTINDRDLAGDAGANARGRLVLHTRDQFASVNATGRSLPDVPVAGQTVLPRKEVADLQGRIDLTRVGLMGHSRGGEGVARALTIDGAEGVAQHGIKAVFALAPTDFARWPVAGVAFATLLPYCDGDVSNLQGAWMYDDARRLEPAAPRHQVLAMGANHNFYNTVWTGDDWGTDGDWCGSDDKGSGRDSPEGQRAHGLGLMASFFRLYVGGETAFAPAWTGNAAWPASMCPEHDSCADRLLASLMPVPADRADLAVDGAPTDRQGIDIAGCMPADCPSAWTIGGARQTAWSCKPGGVAILEVPQGFEGWSALSLRIGVGVGSPDAVLSAEAFGGLGALPLGSVTLPSPPGDSPIDGGFTAAAKTVLSEVRFAWPDATADELEGKHRFTLHCGGEADFQVADVMLVR